MVTSKQLRENVNAAENERKLKYWQAMPFELKVAHAKELVKGFYEHPDVAGQAYIAVGGLDSITLTLFIRSLGFSADDIPAISVSVLEDKSIQKVHRAIGITPLKPEKSKYQVIKEFGYPILSKEISNKIHQIQNPTPANATVRHAIITGMMGEFGGYGYSPRMKLANKWLKLFGGADAEGAALGYQAAPFAVSDKCCYWLKEKPCNDYAKRSGRFPYEGLMESEGGRRAKALKMYGCNYVAEGTKRSCPFASFYRSDVIQLALKMNEWYQAHWMELNPNPEDKVDSIIPAIYGDVFINDKGEYDTSGAKRTGCSMCCFGLQMEKRPHRLDRLYKTNPKEWAFYMNDMGFGDVLDYIGIGWRPEPEQQTIWEQEEG